MWDEEFAVAVTRGGHCELGGGKMVGRVFRSRAWAVGGVAAAGLLSAGGALAGQGVAPKAKFECVKRPTTTSEGAPSAAMLRVLGVLRTPATSADVLRPESPPSFGLGEGVYIKYVRLARTVGETSYYLIPIAKGCGSLGEEVVEEERGPGEFGGSSGQTLAKIKQGQGLSTLVGNTSSTVWGVVPDKVAKVVLTYSRRSTGQKRGRPVRMSAAVVNNVFVAHLAFLTTHVPGGFSTTPRTIVWRSVKGTAIKTIHPKS